MNRKFEKGQFSLFMFRKKTSDVFFKIKAITDDLGELINRIKVDRRQRKYNKGRGPIWLANPPPPFDQSFTICTINLNKNRSWTINNGYKCIDRQRTIK